MMMMFLLHSCPRGGSAKKSFIALPLPRHSFFLFCSRPSFLDEPREETLATQARGSTPRSNPFPFYIR